MGTLAAVVAGWVIGSWLFGGVIHESGGGEVLRRALVSAGIVLLVMLLRRRRAAPAPPRDVSVEDPRPHDERPAPAMIADQSPRDSALDRGVQDIRRMDPKFDPTRFAGYTGMLFRDTQGAWTSRELDALRDRVTPEMYGELQVQRDRMRGIRRSNRVDEVEIHAEITEAWQEDGRDYVTAYIDGSMLDYTVDEITDSLVEGSRTIPKAVEEFWTFTRPAGPNFWMLSAIQVAS